MPSSPVVVGISDAHHLDAVRHAVGEAQLLGRPLRIVHVTERPTRAGESPLDLGHDVEEHLAGLQIERVTLFGEAASVLLAEAEHACRMVIGTDDPMRISTGWSDVALHAVAPVVVVPRGTPPGSREAPVLVAVDGLHPADGQIGFALEAAELRGTGLSVVLAAGATSDYPGRQARLGRLEDELDRWRSLHPSVSITVAVEGGHLVESCLAAGTHASLMVMGRPAGRHPRIGSRSVASRVLRHSHVPVAVVPADYVPSVRSGLTT